MAWRFNSKTGALTGPNGDTFEAYSGNGFGLLNPVFQSVENVGPLPKGLYSIGMPIDPVNHLGPLALPLTPNSENAMYGRDAFYIHGDNSDMNFTASDGCIVAPHLARVTIANSDDNVLDVWY
jgi:hypothetical protein